MLVQHVDAGADVTVGCLEVPRMEATGFGVMHVDNKDNIIAFNEKPAIRPASPTSPISRWPSRRGHQAPAPFLMDQLRRDAAQEGLSRDFGKDIIPYIVAQGGRAPLHSSPASAPATRPRPTGAMSELRTPTEANIDHRRESREPTTTGIDLDRELKPPAKFVHDEDGRRGMVVSSLVSGDCIVSGASLKRSTSSSPARASTPIRRWRTW